MSTKKTKIIGFIVFILLGLILNLPIIGNNYVYSASMTVKEQKTNQNMKSKEDRIVGYSNTWIVKTSFGWSIESSNNNIVTVSKNGNKASYKAKKQGKAIVKIRENTTGIQYWCKVNVLPAVTSIKITNPPSGWYAVGGGYKLFVKKYPVDYKYGSINWKSSNTKVATVSNGTVSFIGQGTAKITATYTNGKNTSVTFNVKKVPTKVTMNPSSIIIGIEETYKIKASYSPSDASFNSAKFTSQNTSIATVNSSTGTVTGKKAGTTYVEYWMSAGGKYIIGKCKVEVRKAPSKLSLNYSSKNLNKGDTFTLSASSDNGAYCNPKDITWSNTNTNVISVTKINGTGKATIKGLKEGTATVTVRVYNGKTAKCTVKVVNNNPIITSAKKIKGQMGDYDYCDNGVSCRDAGSNDHKHGHSCGLNDTFEQSKKSHRNTCCATYVSWVLRDAGIINKTIHGADTLADYLTNLKNSKNKNIFVKVDTNNIQAGDILCYNGHIEISAGGNKVYNAGSVEAINNSGTTNKTSKTITKILRLNK